MTTFASFGLHPALIKATEDSGFTEPTPIQLGTIAHTMAGKDVMACAPTGTGKTAAFVLPMLHKIVSKHSPVQGRGPRALILTPTRELAAQITDNIKTFSRHLRVTSGVLIGGVSYGPQITLLRQNLDILVATPGRLLDHMNERRIDFSRMEMLVLDEADRMLDMGFLKPVEKIISGLPGGQQTLLFSATFAPEIERIAQRVLRNPARVALATARQSHVDITQKIFHADSTEHKTNMLQKLLEDGKVYQAIVFTATKHGADKLAAKVQQWGHKVGALHGDVKQNHRKRTIDAMHNGNLRVLVATDVAARGLDVKNLTHVINYDMPNVPEDYVHRIGRTGRAGAEGIAISLITPPDLWLLRDVENLLKREFPLESVEGAESIMSPQEFRRLRVPKTIRGNQGGGKRQGGGGQRSHGGGQQRSHGNSHGGGGGSRNGGGGAPNHGPRRFGGNNQRGGR